LEEDEEAIEPSPVDESVDKKSTINFWKLFKLSNGYTIVNRVEITKIAEIDSNTRKERKADPQFSYWRGGFDHPAYELRSTFGQRTPFPSYNPYMRQPIIVADPRFLLYYPFTTTTTSTVTTTSRSTPICSQASGFNAC
jgi:hypothetical protein